MAHRESLFVADSPDGCVVETAAIAPILRDFVADWTRKRPSKHGEQIGPYEWLSQDTGLTREEIMRARWPSRNDTTELYIVDALVASIGEPSMFYDPDVYPDGPLRILPNPKAPPERQAECCGGSQSGTLATVTNSRY